MQFFHTSPNKIESITSYGRFDEFLFFSCKIYVMSVGPVITYSLELDESTVIGAGSLFYHEDAGKLSGLVGDFCRRFVSTKKLLKRSSASVGSLIRVIPTKPGTHNFSPPVPPNCWAFAPSA